MGACAGKKASKQSSNGTHKSKQDIQSSQMVFNKSQSEHPQVKNALMTSLKSDQIRRQNQKSSKKDQSSPCQDKIECIEFKPDEQLDQLVEQLEQSQRQNIDKKISSGQLQRSGGRKNTNQALQVKESVRAITNSNKSMNNSGQVPGVSQQVNASIDSAFDGIIPKKASTFGLKL